VDTVPCPVDANKHCFSPISDFEFQPLIPDEQTRAAIVAGMNPVFSISARHPIAGATLLWVLDGKPIDETYQDHTVRRELSEGEHVLRVIDHEGRQAVAMLSPPSIEETVAGDQS
jgi:membrane carboxypeptidase/penicillin-binding protein PbpC